jgi:hypothetical protein
MNCSFYCTSNIMIVDEEAGADERQTEQSVALPSQETPKCKAVGLAEVYVKAAGFSVINYTLTESRDIHITPQL